MKVSVIMIDGSFRENTFGAKYFSEQDLPNDEFEVFWVEYYSNVPEAVRAIPKVKVITLDHPKDAVYHSSLCFNAGIKASTGDLLVIPDADQIVEPDFLRRLRDIHLKYDKLVVYPYRYDEMEEGTLQNHSFEELNAKCIMKNPKNYGGCLSVRKQWMLEVNGYEQHEVFGTGFHANGLDLYTRFKNLGMAIQWEPSLKMYHPWHAFTLEPAPQYKPQKKVIDWRFKQMQYLAFNGIDPSKNASFPEDVLKDDEGPVNPKTPAAPSSVGERVINKLKRTFS